MSGATKVVPPLYKRDGNVRVKLTKEQIEQLSPLLDQAADKPNTGFVIGQYYRGAETANFRFVTAEELQAGIEEAIRIRDRWWDTAPAAEGARGEGRTG